MIRVKREVTLHRKHNQSVYETRNATAFVTPTINLTATVNAVNSMLACASELAVLMPEIIGLSPNNEGWQGKVSEYFHSMSIPVSKIGTTFNTSYTFNINLDRVEFKNRINTYLSDKDIILESFNEDPSKMDNVAFEKEVCDYISGAKGASFAIDEKELYKYVIFENVEDYIKYRFCLVSNRVANDVSLIDKSINIGFYLATNESTIKEQEVQYKQSQDALSTYMKMIGGNSSDVDTYLISFGLIGSHLDLSNLSISQKAHLLQRLAIADPVDFMKRYARPNHKVRATIEKYIWFNVLTRQPNSGVIVDAADPAVIVGNTIDEAIAYMSNKVNAGIISIWENKLNSLLK